MRIRCFMILFACACGDSSSAAYGEPCDDVSDCETDRCEVATSASRRLCTQSCTMGDTCPGLPTGLAVCGPAGFCTEACTDGETNGSGAATELCVSGLFVACSGLDSVASCAACGCEPFGGGVCITGMGCITPRGNGEDCAIDAECASGVCYRDTATCGAPRAEGEPCLVDLECATSNCGADGAGTMGVCNQALGTECRSTDESCSRCIDEGIFGSVCSRDACDPETAPNCPVVGDRRWQCERNTEGGHTCFETCTGGAYLCFEGSTICHDDGFCY